MEILQICVKDFYTIENFNNCCWENKNSKDIIWEKYPKLFVKRRRQCQCWCLKGLQKNAATERCCPLLTISPITTVKKHAHY